MQSSRVTARAVRVLAAGAIAVGVLAPGAAFAASYPNGGTTPTSTVDPGTHVEAATFRSRAVTSPASRPSVVAPS